MPIEDSLGVDVSILIHKAGSGDGAAENELFGVINDRLRNLANGLMRHESPDNSLQASALVNEAYMRLAQQGAIKAAKDRRYLFGAAINSMKQILIDRSRKRKADKHGGKMTRQPIDVMLENVESGVGGGSFEDLHEALDQLTEEKPRQAEVIQLHFLGGVGQQEIAELLGVSLKTIESDVRLAKAKLYTMLKKG